MDNAKQKICIVGPCLTMGGMERASSVLANAFSMLGYPVFYLSIFRHPHFFKLNDAVLFDEPAEGENEKRLSLVPTIRRIRLKVKQYNPDTVIVYNKFYAAITVLALAGTRYPVFISERSSPLFRWRLPLKIFMRMVFGLFHPRGVIAQTTAAAQYQRKYFSNRIPICVIPNALRTIAKKSLPRENWILAVGRLSDPLKGFDRLIPAFANVKNKEWKLVLAGPDENAGVLRRQVTELGLDNRVWFAGKIDDIDEMYAKAGIFVIPSRSEGYPNALAEAMAAGLACISFDFVAGPQDMIEHGKNGLLIEDGNGLALTQAMDHLIENEEERNGLAREATALQKRLNDSTIATQWIDFIFSTKAELVSIR